MDQPGRKADLDKDGIVFADAGKAELDKEGITLESHEDLPQEEAHGPSRTDQEIERKPRFSRRLVLAVAGGSVGLVVLTIVLGVIIMGSRDDAPPRAARVDQPGKADIFGAEGMILDPFMVFYETRVPKRSGVLIAQVSLKVDPAVAPSVESRLYDIRSIIYRRLAAAANVYSQTEIALMLSDDLIDYPIQEVAFVQFNAR